VRPGPEEGRMLPTRSNLLFYGCREVSPGCGGREVPSGALGSAESRAGVFGRRRVFEPSGSGGVEDPRSGSELWRGRNSREYRLAMRGNSGRYERTREGKNASRRVKLTETNGLPFGTRGDREAGLGPSKGSP